MHDAQAGVALLTALALLLLFSVLGTVYVRYMELENERTDIDIRMLRARYAASSSVYATIAEVQAALAANRAPADSYEFALPVYAKTRDSALGFGPIERRKAAARVTVADESGKINLNHASVPVLQAILDIDEEAAKKIVASYPAEAAPEESWLEGGDRTWLISIEDLISRGLLEEGTAVDARLVTFVSVADHANPVGYLNVNAAPIKVLAAVLGIGPDVAQTVAAARPFSTLDQLAAAAGKAPAAFALPSDAMCFTSRCFRIVSKGTYANVFEDSVEYRTSRDRVEAAVIIDATGAPAIRLWRETRGWDESEEDESAA